MSLSAPVAYEQAFVPAAVERTNSPLRRHWAARPLPRIGLLLSILAFSGAAIWLGVYCRQVYYESNGHYFGDVYNALRYGTYAVRYPPLTDFPDTIRHGIPEYNEGKFDYPPLRLCVSYLWAKWVQEKGLPQSPTASITVAPMLALNTMTELVSAIFVFMLIRMWKIRADDAQRPAGAAPAPFRGVIAGLAGALLFWFNPAIFANGHGWPQWDVWFFPFVLGAMLLGSVDCWIGVGILLAVGACFKGQVLLAMPIFVLWPLLRLKFGALLQLAGGFALAMSVVAVPFMRPSDAAIMWLYLLGGSLVLLAPFVLRLRLHKLILAGLAAAALLLAYPWKSDASIAMKLLPVAIVGTCAMAHYLPRTQAPGAFALSAGLCGLLLIPLFHGKTAWYDVSFDYGSRKFMTMAVLGTHNLPSILCSYFRWGGSGEGSPLMTHWVPLLGDVVIRKFLHGVELTCVTLCAIGAAMHSRKPDTRFLLCFAAAMLCAFVVLPQLNDRYVVWAAGLSALLAGVDIGLTLIGVVISIIGWIGMTELSYTHNNESGVLQDWIPIFTRMQVHLGWIMIIAALIYLYMIFAPRNRRLPAASL
jgi:hypothetical protein